MSNVDVLRPDTPGFPPSVASFDECELSQRLSLSNPCDCHSRFISCPCPARLRSLAPDRGGLPLLCVSPALRSIDAVSPIPAERDFPPVDRRTKTAPKGLSRRKTKNTNL